jgi:hypothetical protein
MSWHQVILSICFLLSGGWCLAQTPETQKSESPKSEGFVPLAQLPWWNDQAIVVTDDLKKALDAIGASSVVISGERYREIMNQLKQLSGSAEKGPTEMIFSRCQISGEVKNHGGREIAELQFDLECRTQTADSVVPLSFKGVRFTSASVNNETPIFGPDPEHPSLLIGRPQTAKIHLEALVDLSRMGNDYRLTLARIPSAAITSLELTVPGKVKESSIRGYGSVNIAGTATSSALQANALGVLSSLDLSWRMAAPNSENAIPTIETETTITLDDTAALVDTKMTLVPCATLSLPWTLRLPPSASQLQAELIRPSSTISEPILITKNSDGTVLLSRSYSQGASEYTNVYLRYKQALPTQVTKEKTTLGTCDVLSPKDRQQTGKMTVNLPEEPVVLLRPLNLTQTDSLRVGPVASERKRTLRYQFTSPGAGLEAVPLPRSIIRGAVEVKLQHTLTVRDSAWMLLTDVEVTRSVRTSPSTLEFFWPADWLVNRKILFSPIVRDIDQDQAGQRLRIRLEGKQAGSFSLHLESASAASSNTVNVRLPYLSGVQNLQDNPLEIMSQQEKLHLDSRTCYFRVLGESSGLEETRSPNLDIARKGVDFANSELMDTDFSILNHPAVLSITREPRLPSADAQAEVYFDPKALQVFQTFRIKFDGSVPKQLSLLCPAALKQIRFTLAEEENPKYEARNPRAVRTSDLGFRILGSTPVHLRATKIAPIANEQWDRYLLDIPELSGNTFTFTSAASSTQEMATVTVPLVRIADDYPLLANTLSVRCLSERRIAKLNLPPELPGWSVISQSSLGADQEAKELVLRNTASDRLLALQVEKRGSDYSPKSPGCHIQRADTEAHCLANGSVMCHSVWLLRDITSTQLVLCVEEPFQSMTLDRCCVNGQTVAAVAETGKDLKCTDVSIPLAPLNLLQPTEVAVDFTITPTTSFMNWWLSVPRMSLGTFEKSGELYQQSWRIHADPTSWLLYANQSRGDTGDFSALLPPGPGTDQYYHFQTIHESTSVSTAIVPRAVIIMFGSFFSFLLLKLVVVPRMQKRRPKHQIMVAVFLLGAVGFLFLFSITVLAVFWATLPGVLAAMILVWLERFFKRRRAKQSVFLSPGHISTQDYLRFPKSVLRSPNENQKSQVDNAPTYCPPPKSAVS